MSKCIVVWAVLCASGVLCFGQASSVAPRAASQPATTQVGELFPDINGVGQTGEKLIRFGRSTPAQDSAALAAARKHFAQTTRKWKIKTVEIPTDHCLIVTDADPSEHGFLKKAVETAHAAALRQLGQPATDPVYLGKIPVLVLTGQEPFTKAAEEFDTTTLGEGTPGYFSPDGGSHIVMCLAGFAPEDKDARAGWQHVLTREYMHVLLARWVSNRPLPPWLARGLAEAASAEAHPDPLARDEARKVAAARDSIQELFTEEQPDGQWAAVMGTLIDTLSARDPKALLAMCRAIKLGAAPEAALQASYHMNFKGLEAAWRGALK